MNQNFGTHLPNFFSGVKRETHGVKKRHGGWGKKSSQNHAKVQKTPSPSQWLRKLTFCNS
jgi:hypothetical protein